jgi:hypothetical protein
MATDKMGTVSGSAEVSSAGTAVALESTAGPATRVRSVTITAGSDNTVGEHIVVGDSNVVGALATRRGYPLAPGESMFFDGTPANQRGTHGIGGAALIELADIYVDSITSTDRVSYFAHY